MFRAIFAGALVSALMAGAAQAATVEVKVNDVATAKGRVLLALCIESEFLKKCARQAAAPAARGAVTAKFENVPPGRYAVMAFHDENDNEQIDRSKLGVPTEGMAMSRNAVGRNGPPLFADAAFAVGAAKVSLDIDIVYY